MIFIDINTVTVIAITSRGQWVQGGRPQWIPYYLIDNHPVPSTIDL